MWKTLAKAVRIGNGEETGIKKVESMKCGGWGKEKGARDHTLPGLTLGR